MLRHIRCRSSTYYELGWDANERFNVNKENCDLILELRVNWETRPRGYSPILGKKKGVVRKVKIVAHKREFMSCGSIKPAFVILSLILMGSAFLQVSYSQGPNVTTSTTDPKYETARDQFLKVWDTLTFHPIVATFVNESAELGNGVYQEHSNVFNPDETITLYAQPIGFGHKEITGQNGEKLFLMNFTADIILTTQDGTLIGGAKNIPAGQIVSHYRNTEMFLHLFLTHKA
jgi:hypothetical protein